MGPVHGRPGPVRADRPTGGCLVLGLNDGWLAREIALRSSMFVVCFEKDPAKVATARAMLRQTGLYGSRVVVRHEPGDDPEYPDYFANLVVSESSLGGGAVPYNPARIARMVAPETGVVLFGDATDAPAWTGEQLGAWNTFAGAGGSTWKSSVRGKRPRAGVWPNGTGPNSTMNTGEGLLTNFANLKLQWFGAPYAKDVVDRHEAPVPPLFQDGVPYRLGLNNTVDAIDGYNGTRLWPITVPGLMRKSASHTATPALCSGDNSAFFLGTSGCLEVNRRTGETIRTLPGPLPGYDWGYLGSAGDGLLGTSQGAAADVAYAGALTGMVDAHLATFKSKPTVGKDLFLIDPPTGTKRWTCSGGAILNATITPTTDLIYFVESRNSTATGNTTGSKASWGSHDKGCSPAIGSAEGLFRRHYHHYVYDLTANTDIDLTGVARPTTGRFEARIHEFDPAVQRLFHPLLESRRERPLPAPVLRRQRAGPLRRCRPAARRRSRPGNPRGGDGPQFHRRFHPARRAGRQRAILPDQGRAVTAHRTRRRRCRRRVQFPAGPGTHLRSRSCRSRSAIRCLASRTRQSVSFPPSRSRSRM